jgi:hypothetical protein
MRNPTHTALRYAAVILVTLMACAWAYPTQSTQNQRPVQAFTATAIEPGFNCLSMLQSGTVPGSECRNEWVIAFPAPVTISSFGVYTNLASAIQSIGAPRGPQAITLFGVTLLIVAMIQRRRLLLAKQKA